MKFKNPGVLLIVLFIIWTGFISEPLAKEIFAVPELQEILEMSIIQGNSLLSTHGPVYLNTSLLGSRVLTAWNAVEAQTDSTPCIASSGMNICETDKNIAASNELSFGTRFRVEGIDEKWDKIYEVQDRTNSRYDYRIDILLDEYQEAMEFGRQVRDIIIVE